MIKPAFSGSGIFEIEMALFETRRLKKMRSDYTFGSMDQLNVKIAPKTSQNLTIRAKNCWITDKNRKENLTLIDNYCSNPDLRLFLDILNLHFGFGKIGQRFFNNRFFVKIKPYLIQINKFPILPHTIRKSEFVYFLEKKS